MALSGPQALRSLDEAVRDIRREEDDIGRRLGRSAERIAKIEEAEAELFRQLAELRLTPELRADITGTLSAAEQRAREMLEQHAKKLAELEGALKELDEAVADKALQRHEALEEVDSHQAELKALSARISQAVAQDPEYERKRVAAAELQTVAAESMAKTEQAETDRANKGRPYRDDPLFMYLWERGYGTRNYRANPVFSWLDGKVAGLVGYAEARPNFAMLNDIPLRLREHAERQAQMAQQAEAELDRLENQAIDAAGGQPIREALSAAQAKMAAIDAEMVDLEDQRDDRARAYRELAEGRDPEFEAAKKGLAESLSRQELTALVSEARRTSSSADDALLVKIDDARKRIAEEEADAAEHKARLRVLAARRRELEDIEYEFKKARFDDPRSVFREDNLAGDLLNDFLRGAITAGVYWSQWQRSQSWRPGSSDWGGGYGLPRQGRMPGLPPAPGFPWPQGGGPGGFSRPRSGSRGARRSGGFKTGGGF